MSPTVFGGLALFAGLAAIAALLFALQRLRVRHEERVVVTSLFWNEALEDARARSLVERFRHPLTYLLLLAIASMLWLSVARLDGRRVDGDSHVFLIDGSAGADVEAQVAALEDELARSPSDRTEVLYVADAVVPLLVPGDHRELLSARLDGLEARAVPSRIDATIRARAAARERDGRLRFVVLGDHAVSAATRAALGPADSIESVELDGSTTDLPRITALGVAPAASGTWGRVDVQVDVRGEGAAQASPTFAVDGEALRANAERNTDGDGLARTTLRDVPATGGELVAQLGNGAAAGRDRASLRLPDLPKIRVALDANAVPGELRAVLLVDDAVEIVDVGAEADVAVSNGPTQVPTLVLTSLASTEEAVFVGFEDTDERDSTALLRAALGDIGLDRIDATSLATEFGTAITAGAAPSDVKRVELWGELFDSSRCSFVESRACPIVIARSIRWLAGVADVVPYRAAGEPEPARVGDRDESIRIAALATDGVVHDSRPEADAEALASATRPGSGPWRFFTWLLFLVLGLLVLEWVWFQRRRIA